MQGQLSVSSIVRSGMGLYGPSALQGYAMGTVCCSLHASASSVVGVSSLGLECGRGKFSAINLAEDGVEAKCSAEAITLRRDAEFLLACLSYKIPGFQFSQERLLPAVRSWATGTVVGPDYFGQGYCYLRFFRERFRFRVARILGPVPLVSDVCMMFRLAGEFSASVVIRAASEGCFHVERSLRSVSGRSIYMELLGLIAMNPLSRIGVESSGVERFYCERCKYLVVKDGHELRCTVPIPADPVGDLVGDARHALDVKLLLSVGCPNGSKLTVLSVNYLSSAGQRSYLEPRFPGIIGKNRSDHSWGSAFERQYCGVFRQEYLEWLVKDFDFRIFEFDSSRSRVMLGQLLECEDSLTRIRSVCHDGRTKVSDVARVSGSQKRGDLAYDDDGDIVCI